MLNSRYLSVFWTALTFLGATLSTNAQISANGYIDASFTAPCLSAANIVTRSLLVLPDGRALVGGQFATACGNGILRLQTTGAKDNTFSSPLTASDFVSVIATQSTGKIIIGGQLTGGGTFFPVARLNANGALDLNFTRLTGLPLVANALILEEDNIIAAGAAISTTTSGFIYRFNANGSPDGSFVNGIVTGATANNQGISAIALQGTKIIIGGSFTLVNTNNRAGMAWLNKDTGALDVVLQAAITNADVHALLVQPDGKILVAGQFDTVNGNDRCLTRLNSDGSHDNSFADLNGGGAVTGLALALDQNGKILFGHSHGIARANTNGTIDATFGPLNAAGFLGTDATLAAAVALTPDGNVLVGANRVGVSGTERRGVARLFGNLPLPPFITQQPLTQNVDSGTNVTFSIIATGAPPINFQWRKNATAIRGETNSTLFLEDVDSTDAGNYTVIVSNPGGSVTSSVAKLFVEIQAAPLTLITNGAGVILPKLAAELEIGLEFTITAKPVSGNVFSNWLGGISPAEPQPISSAAELTFVMQSNLVIVANFVPSPFVPVKGVYNGAFFNIGAPSPATAGGVTLTLDENGGIKGSVRTGTRTRKFTGTFSAERVAEVHVPGSATDAALTFQMRLDIPAQIISADVFFGTNTSFATASLLTAARNPFSSKSNPAPDSGLYNAAFPFPGDWAMGPGGDGFMSLTVSTAGRVSGKGTLADGTSLKLVTGLGSDGQVPVYVPLYGAKGVLFGFLNVSTDGDNDVQGFLWWVKPTGIGGTIHPAGFTNVINVFGSRFTTVPANTPVLTLTNGVVLLSRGNLVEVITNSITLGGDNKVVGGNALSLSISPKNGAIKGSFVDPGTNKKRTLQGVALPKQNQGRGLFLGDNESGQLFLGEAPTD